MKPRPVIIGICLGLCVAAIAGVVVQGRRLDALRTEEQQLQLEIETVEANRVVTRPSISPSSELLRLRNQVSMLSRRQLELAAVPGENERLHARLASALTNAASTLLSGYIQKSGAQNVGYSTPQATLQTMLWAIQNRDLTNIVASFTPEAALQIQKELQRSGKSVAEFFKGADILPGLNILDRVVIGDDTMELKLELDPGSGADGQPMRFRRVNGEWKIDAH